MTRPTSGPPVYNHLYLGYYAIRHMSPNMKVNCSHKIHADILELLDNLTAKIPLS